MGEILFFSSPNCGACKKLKPVITKIAVENNIPIYYLSYDTDKKYFEDYKVQGLPTVIRQDKGEEVGRLVGLHPVQEVRKLLGVE